MKRLVTIALLLASCSPPEVTEVTSDQIVQREGLTYQVNSVEPFTGIAVNYYGI